MGAAQQLTAQLDLEIILTDSQGKPLEDVKATEKITGQQPAAEDIVLAGNQLQAQLR